MYINVGNVIVFSLLSILPVTIPTIVWFNKRYDPKLLNKGIQLFLITLAMSLAAFFVSFGISFALCFGSPGCSSTIEYFPLLVVPAVFLGMCTHTMRTVYKLSNGSVKDVLVQFISPLIIILSTSFLIGLLAGILT